MRSANKGLPNILGSFLNVLRAMKLIQRRPETSEATRTEFLTDIFYVPDHSVRDSPVSTGTHETNFRDYTPNRKIFCRLGERFIKPLQNQASRNLTFIPCPAINLAESSGRIIRSHSSPLSPRNTRIDGFLKRHSAS